ncbi:Arc family DNA-binding protein [Phaeobacter inhibens]|uniref:Arc family DNA-binding protein n=1 Tax=Phaeobacter inhibens TaxID=221822 RepID=UPI000C9BE800|nr:Arc family DNA-binding protein [Phaeobacter inhibens]AUR22519.1 helix-turn-helix domain-containing protein [Phaeobacter inhibens]
MKQYKFAFPSWMHERLAFDARMNCRSLGSEIIYRLRKTVTLEFTDIGARLLMRRARKLRAKNPRAGSDESKLAAILEDIARTLQIEMNDIYEEARLGQIPLE